MNQPIILPATPDQFSVMAVLFEAQLREHNINSSVDALIATLHNVDSHPDHGFILSATLDGLVVGVAYASSLLSIALFVTCIPMLLFNKIKTIQFALWLSASMNFKR